MGVRSKIIVDNHLKVNKDIQDRVRNIILDLAHEGASIASDLAPRGTRPRDASNQGWPRLYKSIKVEIDSRKTVRIVADAPHAHFVEFGTQFQAAHPFMRVAIESLKTRGARRLGQVQAGLGKKLKFSTRRRTR